MPTLPTRPLGQLLRRPPRYGINAAAVPLGPQLPTYLRITDIDESGRFAPNPKVGVDHAGASNYRLAPGELVFARTGASVGKSYLYDPADGELIYAGFLINVAPDPARLNPKYLSLIAQTKEYWDWIARTSVRSGQPGVNGREYATLPVPVPDIAVQDAIAGVMTDVDNLITGLERLYAKKQAIKQGMLQQLLTGKTRLPGFTDSWVETRLGSVGKCMRGVAYNPGQDLSAADRPFTVRLLRSNNVQDGQIDRNGLQFVHQRCVSTAQFLEPGDIVICMANGSRALVGKAAMFEATRSKHRYTFGAFMGAFRTDKSLASSRFVAEAMRTYAFRNWLDVILSGSSINNLRPGDVEGFVAQMPELDEQTAIAAVLGDADREIQVLSTRLSKATAIKQGMMQELLTGRTRLPVEASL